MDRSHVQTRHVGRLHVSIRELLALAAIVALALSLYFAKVENAKLKAKLDVLYPRPHIWLHDLSPFEETYTTTANIGMTGQLYPNYAFTSKSPTVSAKMVDPTTGQILCESAGALDLNLKGGFGFNLRQRPNLAPGFYPILVEIFDGKERIANGISTVQLVDLSPSHRVNK